MLITSRAFLSFVFDHSRSTTSSHRCLSALCNDFMEVAGQYLLASRRLRQIWTGFLMLPEEVHLWQVVLKAQRQGVITSSSHMSSKPVGYKHLGCYLSLAFSASERAAVVRHTYGFLEGLKSRSLKITLSGRRPIWSFSENGANLVVSIGPSSLAPMEGEVALIFTSNDRVLCTMSFSIVPGRLVGVSDADAILIGGLQGGLTCQSEIRDASKRLHEIAPQDLLVVTVRALARVLGMETIAGVASDMHVARECSKIDWSFDYDGFWEKLGAFQSKRGFFVFSPDVVDKPLSAASGSHRSRARRKRRVKLLLQKEMEARFRICLSVKPDFGRFASLQANRDTASTLGKDGERSFARSSALCD